MMFKFLQSFSLLITMVILIKPLKTEAKDTFLLLYFHIIFYITLITVKYNTELDSRNRTVTNIFDTIIKE